MTRLSPRTTLLSGLLAATLGATCAPSPPTDADGNPLPDVVLIMIDTLRPDHLPFYGYETRDTAPFLSGLAEESAVFERSFSTSSWTAPSTASVFTSLYPVQHGVVQGFFAHRRRIEEIEETGSSEQPINRMPRAVPTLPEFFRNAGYRTWGLAANVNIGEEIGFDRGFDKFKKIRDDDDPKQATARGMEELLGRWMKAEGDSEYPTFLYLHFNDVHYPYKRHKGYYEKQKDDLADDIAGYDSEISFVDDALKRLFERYRWKEDAIVMLVSDHGQEFLEHGQKGHKTSLYRELVQVLMMVHAPQQGVQPRRIQTNASLIDVLPTLMDLAGIETRGDWEGSSLRPLLVDAGDSSKLEGRTLFAHRVELGENEAHLFAAIQDRWKVIQTRNAEGIRIELYDYVSDPLEKNDRFDAEPERGRAMNAELQFFQSLEPRGDGEVYRFQMDEEMLRQLEALGYVDGAEEG